MPTDLRGRAIAITGASSGIGAATALACAAAGMPVALAARRADRLEQLAQRIRGMGVPAIAFELDVTDAARSREFVEVAAKELGNLYAVFANAGYGHQASFEEESIENIRKMFEVNFFGSLHVIKPALEVFRRQSMPAWGRDVGHVLWCSSCLSRLSIPHYGTYCATKSSQHHMGKAMAGELRGAGIHVSTVHPIGTKTEFFDTAAKRSTNADLLDRSTQGFMQSASYVGDRIVRCLKRPKDEVWTGPPGTLMRYAMAATAAAPGLGGWLVERAIASRRKKK